MQKINIAWPLLAEVRSSSQALPIRKEALENIAKLLASETPLQRHMVEETLVKASRTIHISSPSLVQALTGVSPETRYLHPNKDDETVGIDCFATATLANTLILLRRLGVNIDIETLCGPLRAKLKDKTARPTLTQDELEVLWYPKRDKAVQAYVWLEKQDEKEGSKPYAVRLFDGRVAIGFVNLEGRRVEVIGQLADRNMRRKFLESGGEFLPVTFAELKKQVLAEPA